MDELLYCGSLHFLQQTAKCIDRKVYKIIRMHILMENIDRDKGMHVARPGKVHNMTVFQNLIKSGEGWGFSFYWVMVISVFSPKCPSGWYWISGDTQIQLYTQEMLPAQQFLYDLYNDICCT